MLTRWQPFSELNNEFNQFQKELNRLFGRFPFRVNEPNAFPAMNIWQDQEQLILEAELPGMNLEDLEIFVDGENHLTVKGHRKMEEKSNGTWHRQERNFGEFRRTIELPNLVDPEKVEAVLKNGVLTITLPKKEEVKPRKIEVKVN
jgi:HSP20 family protein